jgi:hypothetical protein
MIIFFLKLQNYVLYTNKKEQKKSQTKIQKKKVQMAVTYHTLVSQGMSNLCISVLFIPVVYIAMCYHISNNAKWRSLELF